MATRKPQATISIDVDSLWVITDSIGQTAELDETAIYDQAIPRFLELFDQHDVRVTFFCVGRDLTLESNRKILRQMVAAGHEIGNHSFNHPTQWVALSPEAKRSEVAAAHRTLLAAGAREVIGYRGSGYYVDADVHAELEALQYVYDSSVFPGLYSAVVLPTFLNLKERKLKPRSMGRPADIVAPRRPYPLKRQSGRLWELPISATPIFRMPFHSSMIFMLGTRYFDLCLNMHRLGDAPLNYVFHAVDLLPDRADPRLTGHFVQAQSLPQRQQTVEHILKRIRDSYEPVAARELIESSPSDTTVHTRMAG